MSTMAMPNGDASAATWVPKEDEFDADMMPDLPIKVCHLGQAAVAAALLVQAMVAACGATASAGAEPMRIARVAGWPSSSSDTLQMFNLSFKIFRFHLAGALFAASMAWLVLAPGLEFSLAASAILIATGAVAFALAFDPPPAAAPVTASVAIGPPVLGRESA